MLAETAVSALCACALGHSMSILYSLLLTGVAFALLATLIDAALLVTRKPPWMLSHNRLVCRPETLPIAAAEWQSRGAEGVDAPSLNEPNWQLTA